MTIVTRVVPLPVDPVWRVLADVRTWPQWLPTVTALTPLEPERPEEVGSAYRLVQPRLRPGVWTVTDWRPGAGFTWESRQPGVRSVGRHDLRPVDGGTELTLTLDWSGPLAPLVRLALGRMSRRYVETEARAVAERAASLTS